MNAPTTIDTPAVDEDGPRRNVTITITRTQTTTMWFPADQPLTADALDDADWEHIWDHQDYDTETTNVTVTETPDDQNTKDNS